MLRFPLFIIIAVLLLSYINIYLSMNIKKYLLIINGVEIASIVPQFNMAYAG